MSLRFGMHFSFASNELEHATHGSQVVTETGKMGGGRDPEHTVKSFGPQIEYMQTSENIYLFQSAIKSSVSSGELWLRRRATKAGNDDEYSLSPAK